MGYTWTWQGLVQSSRLLSVWFCFQAFYILSAILEYILSYAKPPKLLLAYLQFPLLPKVSLIIMHLSQNTWHFFVLYHQPTFEHQDRSFIVEVFMTLFGELPVSLKRKIALLSDVEVSQPLRARHRGSQGRKVGWKLGKSIW